MPFYVIRTLTTGDRFPVSNHHAFDIDGEYLHRVYDFASIHEAHDRANSVPGNTSVHEFRSTREMREYCSKSF